METKQSARELLREAWEILADAKSDGKDGLSEGTLSMIGKTMTSIDAYLAAPSNKCQRCDGKGWTAEHSTDANAHDGEGNCNPGYCPVQVQCEACGGTGRAAPSESAMETVEKIRGNDDEIGFFHLTDTEAAALIEGLQRRVPDNYLREEKELLAAKDEYIALLEKASGEGAMFAYIHGSHVPQADIDAGIRCRAKIAELSAKHSVVIE